MTESAFAPSILGGPWSRRHGLAARRAWVDELPWSEPRSEEGTAACWAWTQTTYSEYAAAASFAAINSALLAAQAPLDLVAATSEFVIDELIHVEVSARIAAHLGGGVPLKVDLERLVRPPHGASPRLRAAELIVRTCCVGEAMTIPQLDRSRRRTTSPLIAQALRRILRDEVPHAQLGGWFLEWADGWLNDDERAHLGRIASTAVASFAPLLEAVRHGESAGQGRSFGEVFAKAVEQRVARPLRRYGIELVDGRSTRLSPVVG